MQQRGRKSLGSLALISSSDIDAIQRPGPPPELTEEQSEEWIAVVNRMPADWFGRETFGLLCAYVRHVVAARKVAQLVADIEVAPSLDVEAYDKALKMQEREGRALSTLAMRMRISQHSQYDKTRKNPRPAAKRPW